MQSEYSFKNSDCRRGPLDNKSKLQLADPITVVMKGYLHGFISINNVLSEEAGWGSDLITASQYFIFHDGGCGSNQTDNSDQGDCRCNRWHARGIYQGPHDSRVDYGELTPHRDIWTKKCSGPFGGNHYVQASTGSGSGFDRGKQELTARLSDHYHTDVTVWSNTVTMKQCNGQLAGSNGAVYFIYLGQP
jgi:hypothetical protein